MNNIPNVDLQQTQRFLDAIAPNGIYAFQTFDDSDQGRKGLARILHGTLEQHAPELTRLNKAGAGVFIMVNRGDGQGRTEKNVVAVRAVFADCDGAPLEPLLDYAPHITIESSPGRYHAYWRMADCQLDQFSTVQHKLAAKFNSDKSVNDLPRVMRLPGFFHRKRKDAPFMTRILNVVDATPINLADFEKMLGFAAAATAAQQPEQSGSAVTNGGAIIAGSRNQTLTSDAGMMQRRGMGYEATLAALVARNAAHCQPPLPLSELHSIVRSVARYSPEIYRDAVKPSPPFPAPEVITADEWQAARSTPDCIVQDLFYADVAVLVAPGGMGKTTLKLREAISITLGLPLYGLTVHKPGAVLIITAEDSREMLIARLRAICHAMQLTDADIATVMQRVRISDVSGAGFKLTEISGDVVRPCEGIDQIIEACQTIQPVLIVIDPAVSFGVGESRVNDAEQGLIEAARKLRKALDCCIQYIHHSGKQNARDKAVDQYAGRGGSAFADGARMVHVLQSLTPDEWRNETGTELLQGESGLRLARPKMSYCAPQDDILIRRNGYHFAHVERITTSKQAKREDAANLLWGLIDFDLSQGRYHSRNTLEALDSGLKRNELRAALDLLFASLRIENRDVPNAGKGGKRAYLHPIGSPNHNGEAIENEAIF